MPNPEPDIYIYKMPTDNGGAPCVAANLLSLAICKPKIRKSAEKGSLIFGFGGKAYGERLLYIACVTQKLQRGEYYRERAYAKRPDCIYLEESGLAVRKKKARYHFDSDHRRKDVGLHFENAFVLLSDNFRYFGRKGTAEYKERFPNIRKTIEGLKQGHRRYLSAELRKELLALKKMFWGKYRRMKIGAPTDGDYNRTCNGNSPSGQC
jgi:hypothetical protein